MGTVMQEEFSLHYATIQELCRLKVLVTECVFLKSIWARQFLSQALYLWQAPKAWIGPVGEGDSGSVVSEIVDAFAELDSLPAPPLDTFTPALAGRVREFQRLVGLEVDGVMDAQTWQVLNDRRGRGFTLEKANLLASSKSGGAECR